jgi:hypothetical protein
MARYLVRSCAPILIAVVASVNVAIAQLPANLSATMPVGGLLVNSLSADLSVHDGPSNLGAGGDRSRRALMGGFSQARSGGGSSLSGGFVAPSLGSYGPSMTLLSGALSSRALLSNKNENILEDASSLSGLKTAKPPLRGTASTRLSGLHVRSFGPGRRSDSHVSAPRSFQSRSSVPGAPLYSLLVRHEKGSPRSAKLSESLSLNPGHTNKSRGALIQSLSGVGSGHGSSHQ